MTQTLLQMLVSGILVGGLYALTALGLTIILGVMRHINLAHGIFYTVGAYLTYAAVAQLGLGFLPALLAAAGGAFLVGVLVERICVRPIRHAELQVMIVTLAVAFIGEELVKLAWGPKYRNLPPYFLGNLHLGEIFLEKQRVAAFLAALTLMGLFILLLRRTRLGKAVRMVAQDEEAARLLGINVENIHIITFGMGAALAASAAALLGPIYLIFPAMGWTPLLRAFAIVILGGMGSVEGTILAGLLFGVIEVLTGYFIDPTLVTVNIFLVLILMILVRPQGIFGVKVGGER